MNFAREGLLSLPITHFHAAAVAYLPDVHGDPFDRLLVAQAQIEDLTLMTRDPRVREYPIRTLAA